VPYSEAAEKSGRKISQYTRILGSIGSAAVSKRAYRLPELSIRVFFCGFTTIIGNGRYPVFLRNGWARSPTKALVVTLDAGHDWHCVALTDWGRLRPAFMRRG
jgi:hypothetical protein